MVNCEVAREALSARLDGEAQPVLAHQLDAHLRGCRDCREWLIAAAAQTRHIAVAGPQRGPDLTEQILAGARARAAGTASLWWRGGLIVIGVGQLVLAVAQIAGLDFGMVHTEGHGAATGAHLLHESTAWLVALGVAMIAAGFWTVAAVGVAAITGAYTVALVGYVAVDAVTGQVTVSRALSHIPILLGLFFVLLVVRDRFGSPRRGRGSSTADTAIPWPEPGRRDHLRPVNRTAA
ncbi:hypothetical protein AWC30_16375 [Mycolicibacillus trivialis]|uniref:Zinc-finger domain-containing protein n=1 Tax=Mycolicibacillus trivialis TaxID=1798 RepID=A0A1X2EEP5_9MYCO|nr:hypothetical protein AWC30_16375 [Mycolicibacillus trivialis]